MNIAIKNPLEFGENNQAEKSLLANEKLQKIKTSLTFSLAPISSHLSHATIAVNPDIVEMVYAETIDLFRQKNLDGLSQQEIPTDYVEEHFKNEITKKLKNYLFKHVVIDFLLNEIITRKIPLSNYPRLKKIEITPTKKFSYIFDLSLTDPLELKEWKHFSFKPPKRKKYKDLDKQVENFLDQEAHASKKQNDEIVEESDWVCFQALLLDKNKKPLPKPLSSILWIKIKNEEVIDPLKELFIGKKITESFVTNNLELDESINDYENYRFNFLITINAIIKGSHLSLDCFRTTFKLKNKIEIHNKLMEVFSYRNDQSQRKSIIEELFHLFLTKHRFEVPKHLILRRQEDILLTLMQQPDYQVYKAQKDFVSQIEQLAEKQLKEEIIIDQIAYKEGIKIDNQDSQNYLHLFNNKRLREFVYFKPLLEKIDKVNTPMNASLLGQSVLREKTLNYIIHVLTR